MALFSLQIEKHVLSGLINNPEVIADVDRFVGENDFVAKPHSVIYSCIRQAFVNNEKIDRVLLAQKIKNLGISFKDDIDIFDYIKSISFTPVTPQATIRAASELVKFRVLRDLEVTLDIMKDTINKNVNNELDATIGEIDALYGQKINSFDINNEPERLFDGFYDEVEERGNNPMEEIGIPTPFPEFNRLYGGFRRKNLYIFAARAKAGKALEENTPIPTPKGFVKIKDLNIGDEVFTLDGQITKVTNKAYWKNRQLYKVTTCDKQHIICDEAHEWPIRKRVDYPWEIMDTKSLYQYNITQSRNIRPQTPSLPLSMALVLPKQNLPIDPYILGIWLGNGTFARSHADYLTFLCKFDLISNKHIPSIYLRASIEQRRKLLQGLIDSNDCIDPKTGRVEFCNKNLQLSQQILELIHSLGIKASLRKNPAKLYGKAFVWKYRINFHYKGACLPSCKEKFPNRHIKARPFGRGNTVCIEVEHKSHIFLCGKAMIPTHNSTFLAALGMEISKTQKIPVLILDTEMSRYEVKYRSGAAKTQVGLWHLKTGNWRKNNEYVQKVRSIGKALDQDYNQVYHMAVGNKPIEEIAAICRRWYYKYVGRGKDCLFIYDYIKIIGNDEKSRREYQEMGDKVDFIKKLSEELDSPFLTACQNNREGVVGDRASAEMQDDERSIGLSDRITHFASGVWIFRQRTPDEVALDTPHSGSHKLIEIVIREQGREATGYNNRILRRFPDGKKKWVKNFININIENFEVEERGTLRDTISWSNSTFLVRDETTTTENDTI